MTAEKTKKELEILSNSESLREVIAAAPSGIVIVNPEGQIVIANRQAESIFGYRGEELFGQPVDSLISESFRGKFLNLRSGSGGKPVPRPLGQPDEMYGRRKDGSEFPIDIGVAPMKTTEGFFILSAIVDNTLRQQLESRYRRRKEIEAQESERRRLARELHDELGQLLSAISLDLHAAKGDYISAASRLDETIGIVDQAIEQVCDLTLDLRPPMLDDLGLIATLRWYADRMARRADLVLHFVAESSGASVPSENATACYRIFQEALTNVIRHSQARQVWIELREVAGNVQMSIRDDGIGFNPESIDTCASAKGYGVIGMRERVDLLGGTIEINSMPTEGTTISVWIPTASAETTQRI